MNRRIRGKILIVLGFLLVFTATGIFMYYDIEAQTAGENAKILLESYKAEKEITFESPVVTDSASGEMPQQTLMGYNLIGVISFPSVAVELPVLSSWDYELLKISACRYSGSVKGNDLIILGHDYEHHFGMLKNCSVGEQVSFTDVNGNITGYTISKIETLHKTELDKLTSVDADLTVFTCTTGGQYRLVLRCKKSGI